MARVNVKKNETIESALRRFNKKCSKSGIRSEIKKREYYEKPSDKRKKRDEKRKKQKK
ncbi:30S ribosomal protein S21 [Natranaerofaba carboxydovora]|uniref:30S ribosomal protein S21 n=1 Tax=Natranaerofaba carboxydovora TaxID=2742683 RepID=UPI001F1336E7|nr:30S ribosomal protein S21 [Natranaerofaba carboxydovora]UMZ73080.1 30S ribosomal protein S21 [Natranaerofaba carboxydovora]